MYDFAPSRKQSDQQGGSEGTALKCDGRFVWKVVEVGIVREGPSIGF